MESCLVEGGKAVGPSADGGVLGPSAGAVGAQRSEHDQLLHLINLSLDPAVQDQRHQQALHLVLGNVELLDVVLRVRVEAAVTD
jgi:Trp operon repressor